MFAKLLKHEWKANSKILSVIMLASLGGGVLGTVLLKIMVNYIDNVNDDNAIFSLILLPMMFMVIASFLAILACAVGTQFILLYRFYKHKFTDEGYLTFTLPVKTKDIFLSSAVHITIWTVISAIVSIAMFMLIILVGTAEGEFINSDMLNGLSEGWHVISLIYGGIFSAATGVLSVITVPVSMISSVVLMLTCIVMGATYAKKHKILAAFGFYYASNVAINIITSFISVFTMVGTVGAGMDSFDSSMIIMCVLQLIIHCGIIFGGYYLSSHLMKNRLNLP